MYLFNCLQYSLPSTWAQSDELQFHFGAKWSGFAASQNTHNKNYKLQRNMPTSMNIQKKFCACHALHWFPDQWRVKQCVSFLLSRPLGLLIIADCELFRDLDFYYPACTGSIAVGCLLTCSISAITYTMVNSKNIILKTFPSFNRQSLHQHFFKDVLAGYDFILLQMNKWVNLLLLPIFPQATSETFTEHKGCRNKPKLLWQNKLRYLSWAMATVDIRALSPYGSYRVVQLPWALHERCWGRADTQAVTVAQLTCNNMLSHI